MNTQSLARLTFTKIPSSAFLALITLLIVLGAQGFEHGSVNNFRDQSIQLPVIYSYANPNLFVGDFLVEARDSYVTWFYPVIGWVSRLVPLKALMIGLYALSIGLTITGVYRIARALYPRRNVGVFAVILWMVYFPNPGGDFTHSPFVTHTTFAIAIEMWALVYIFRRRYGLAALLLGVAANINAMTAFFVAFMWMFSLIRDRRNWTLDIFRWPLIIAVFALPVLYWRLSLPLNETALDQFVEVIRARLWYAVFPLSIEPILWIGFFALLALWRYSLRYGKPEAHDQVIGMLQGIAVVALVGIIFSEVFPVEFIIELQLIRSTWLINLLIMFYIAHMFSHLLDSNSRRPITVAFALIFIMALPRWYVELFPPAQPTPYPLAVDLDTAWADRNPLSLGVILSLAAAGLLLAIWRMTQRGEVVIRRDLQPGVVVVWFAFSILIFVWPAFTNSNVPEEQLALNADWEETLVWIEENTPVDAVFYSPPQLDGFRVGAMRSYIGDWKDGTVGIFENSWAIEWYDRMEVLGFDSETFSFVPMTQARLCWIVTLYDVDYAVVMRDWDIVGESVFANEYLAVFPAAGLRCPAYAGGSQRQK